MNDGKIGMIHSPYAILGEDKRILLVSSSLKNARPIQK